MLDIYTVYMLLYNEEEEELLHTSSSYVLKLRRELNIYLGFSSLYLTVLANQNGRVAIVTGGARGLGYETVRQLVNLGMFVIIGIVQLLLS